jgi:hypothetical protein
MNVRRKQNGYAVCKGSNFIADGGVVKVKDNCSIQTHYNQVMHREFQMSLIFSNKNG